jgi:hypothetical protein
VRANARKRKRKRKREREIEGGRERERDLDDWGRRDGAQQLRLGHYLARVRHCQPPPPATYTHACNMGASSLARGRVCSRETDLEKSESTWRRG